MTEPSRDPLRLWAESVVPVEEPPTAQAREQASVERVKGALRQVREARKRALHRNRRLALSAAAIVTLLGAWLLQRAHSRSEPRPAPSLVAGAIGRFRIAAGSARTVHEGRESLTSAQGTAEVDAASSDEIATL